MKWKAIGLVLLKSVLPIVAGLTALILVIAYLAGAFTPKIPPGQRTAEGRSLQGRPVAVVRSDPRDYLHEAIGTLKASRRTVISSKVLATVEAANVTTGDQVEEGTVLFRLSSRELDARLRQTQQSLLAAQASRRETELAYQRAEKLRRTGPGTISQSEFEQAVAKMQVARADELRMRQAVTEAEVLLSYTTIKAPRAGRVIDRLAEPGDTVGPGDPLIVLYDPTSLRLEAPVVERLAVQLKPRQRLKMRIDALDREVEGEVDAVVPQAEAMSRSFLVKVTIPQADDLYEGMFGRLYIPAGSRRHLSVPKAVVREIGQLEFVDVVLRDDTLQRRLVKTGRTGQSGQIEVLSGLSEGERVVVYGGMESQEE